MHSSRQAEYVIEYMAAAGLGLIVHWLEDDLSMPVEELTQVATYLEKRSP